MQRKHVQLQFGHSQVEVSKKKASRPRDIPWPSVVDPKQLQSFSDGEGVTDFSFLDNKLPISDDNEVVIETIAAPLVDLEKVTGLSRDQLIESMPRFVNRFVRFEHGDHIVGMVTKTWLQDEAIRCEMTMCPVNSLHGKDRDFQSLLKASIMAGFIRQASIGADIYYDSELKKEILVPLEISLCRKGALPVENFKSVKFSATQTSMSEAPSTAPETEVPSQVSLPDPNPPPKTLRYSEGEIVTPSPEVLFWLKVANFSEDEFAELPGETQKKLLEFSNTKVVPLLREAQSVATKQIELSAVSEKVAKGLEERKELENYLSKFLIDRSVSLSGGGSLREFVSKHVALTQTLERKLDHLMTEQKKRSFEDAFAYTFSSAAAPNAAPAAKKLGLSDEPRTAHQSQPFRKSVEQSAEFDFQSWLASKQNGNQTIRADEVDFLSADMLNRMTKPARQQIQFTAQMTESHYPVSRINVVSQNSQF